MLEAKEGWYFADDFQTPVKMPDKTAKGAGRKESCVWGTHGFLPQGEDYQTFFAMAGCCVRPGIVEQEIALWDEGATLAALLGVELGKMDGRVIDGMLEG